MGSAARQLGTVERRTRVCDIGSERLPAQLMWIQRLDMALPKCNQRWMMGFRPEKFKDTVQAPVSVHEHVLGSMSSYWGSMSNAMENAHGDGCHNISVH